MDGFALARWHAGPLRRLVTRRAAGAPVFDELAGTQHAAGQAVPIAVEVVEVKHLGVRVVLSEAVRELGLTCSGAPVEGEQPTLVQRRAGVEPREHGFR